MLDLLKNCYNCFLLSLFKKHLNENIMYYNLLHSLTSLSFLHSFLFLSTFSVFQKSLNNHFFRRLAWKSLLSRFSGFFGSKLFIVQVFLGPGFSRYGSMVRNQVLEITLKYKNWHAELTEVIIKTWKIP